MLVADSLDGPWAAVPDENTPLLGPPDDQVLWCYGSGCGVTNPTLLVHLDGRFLLYFKAMSGPRPQGKVSMGVAVADNLEGPYTIQPKSITTPQCPISPPGLGHAPTHQKGSTASA